MTKFIVAMMCLLTGVVIWLLIIRPAVAIGDIPDSLNAIKDELREIRKKMGVQE